MNFRTSALILGLASAGLSSTASGQLFVENFDDGSAASRWSAPIFDTELGVADGFVDYAFDYSTFGIPAAPGGATTTTGIRFAANVTDDAGDEGVAIGVLSNYTLPAAGDFSVTMDVYAFSANPATDPTTEYITLGIAAAAPNDPTNPAATDDVPARFGISKGNGLAWQVVADDGTASAVFRFEDANNAGGGTETNLGATGIAGAGDVFLNQWAPITITSTAGIITYSANGIVYDTYDNTAGTFSGGSLMIGLTDVFNSAISGDSVFLVIDNVSVVPEPATAALLGLGALAMLRRRSA